jgi:hypothetical protein
MRLYTLAATYPLLKRRCSVFSSLDEPRSIIDHASSVNATHFKKVSADALTLFREARSR